MFFLFGFLFVRGRARRVTLGGGRLRVGLFRKSVPFEKVAGIRYRRALGVLPLVVVKIGEIEISWPRSGRGSEEVERAVRAAVVLHRLESPAAVMTS